MNELTHRMFMVISIREKNTFWLSFFQKCGLYRMQNPDLVVKYKDVDRKSNSYLTSGVFVRTLQRTGAKALMHLMVSMGEE